MFAVGAGEARGRLVAVVTTYLRSREKSEVLFPHSKFLEGEE